MDISNKRDMDSVLKEAGFSFKKSLGQNFLIDSSVCPKMAQSCADGETGVIEIGPGAGVLSTELAKVAKRVVCIEIDERLKPVLTKTLSGYDNVKIVWGDVLKVDLQALIESEFKDCKKVNVCANLPYYITSPIVMGLLSKNLPINSITVMVQKEAADRLCAKVGTREAGAVTAAVAYYSEAELLFNVGRNSFYPSPRVDSAVIKLSIRKTPAVTVKDEKFFFLLVKSCFAQRRKTLLNTVSNTLGIEKQCIRTALTKLDLSESVRGEALSLEQLAELSDLLKD